MIALLGSMVILFQLSLPHRLDSCAEPLVGLTLILLAMYAMTSLIMGKSAEHSSFVRSTYPPRLSQTSPQTLASASGCNTRTACK